MRTSCLAVGSLLVLLALAERLPAGTIKFPKPTSCIMTLIVSRADCPWSGMTDSYQQEQSNKYVRAGAFGAATNGAMSSLAEFDKPDVLMVRDIRQKSVAVNSRYFSDLHRGDATRLGMGQTHVLGKFLDLTFTRLKPSELVMFLLKSQVIETYWHLEAELRLLRIEDSPAAYRALFHGVHTYFTNDRNEQSFAFVVAIDKKTGEMTLAGGDVLDVRGPREK